MQTLPFETGGYQGRVCTENLNADVMVVKSAEQGV